MALPVPALTCQYLPFYYPARNDVGAAWIIAVSFAGISFGWAAGDVSLAAYIQAALTREEKEDDDISNLGAVMSFLYASYIVRSPPPPSSDACRCSTPSSTRGSASTSTRSPTPAALCSRRSSVRA